MSVKKDASGRRYIEVEVEVPGTPEEVWDAIATGPGVSSWFVPTEEGEGGTVVSHFGPGMDVVATRTAWEPPRRFAGEGGGFGPGAPPLAAEWTVEARAGGTCVVRLVHSLFASGDDWDNQLESIESGWPSFFRTLRLHLTHFRGQRGSGIHLVSMVPGPESKVWDALTRSLGLTDIARGQKFKTPAGLAPLEGVIEEVGNGKHPHQIHVSLQEPTPGIAHFFVHAECGPVFVENRFYFYGPQAGAAVQRDEPLWQSWLTENFSPPGEAAKV